MTCPRCQSPTSEGARFCEECGLEQADTIMGALP